MIIKTPDGRELEAVSLLMKKENALDIISGKKKVEMRDVSDYYIKMFKGEKGTDEELMRYIYAIHFYNYSNSWFLDVEVDNQGFCVIDGDAIKDFNELYDFHDWDDKADELNAMPKNKRPATFWFELGKVIATNIQ